jgi:hypothetical protein
VQERLHALAQLIHKAVDIQAEVVKVGYHRWVLRGYGRVSYRSHSTAEDRVSVRSN